MDHQQKEKIMLINFIKVAFRSFSRQKIYSLINLSGLALGMALCAVIVLYIQTELSYDRFHENADQIYRVAEESTQRGSTVSHANIFPIIGPNLVKEFPEVLDAVRFERDYRVLVNTNGKKFIEDRFFYADPSVFNIFSFPLITGNPKTALRDPYSILLTEETAQKYFGDKNPLGKTLNINHEQDFKVTGILKNVPQNSHIQFDFLASISTLEARDKNYGKIWGSMSAYTYILLAPDTVPQKVTNKFPDFIKKHRSEKAALQWKFFLQPLTQIHLQSHLNYELEANSDIKYIHIFSAIALFMLILAGINFMNLSTARSSKRAKEVGIKKVLGVSQRKLAKQFMAESVIMTLTAVPVSLILIEILSQSMNSFFQIQLNTHYFNNPITLLGLLVLALFLGFFSGTYPAFVLSSFKPASVLQGKTESGIKGALFRRILVVVQFSISVFLITGTLIIHDQLNFIQNENLGFEKENILFIPIQDENMRKNFQPFKTRLLQNPDVLSISASTGLPSIAPGMGAYIPQGLGEEDAIAVRHLLCDYDFIQTYGLGIKQGRDFNQSITTDQKQALIINETAAETLGWKNPVGQILINRRGEHMVIGVVKDFHFRSKHQKIEPLVLSLISDHRYIYLASIKIRGGNTKHTMNSLKSTWKSFSSAKPLEYFFLNDQYDQLYKSEVRTTRMFDFFTGMAILISCLGLFGLAAYTSEQRTKEMGIRKVLGASVSHIFYLLSSEFTKWIFLSNLIAWPVAYYFMSKWLENFAYRIQISTFTFILSALIAFVIALLTVSFQAVKTALSNPVDSLRYE
ncbi:MAG: FtsX-like permease family protein [Candidatus Aminicenantes bacterium]|nr:FtsX-like permease family protein [Candidatus Aminicenantes bacterium]